MSTDLINFCRDCKNKSCKEICTRLQKNIPEILAETKFEKSMSIEEYESQDPKIRPVAIEEVPPATQQQYELVREIVNKVVKNRQSAKYFLAFIESNISMTQIAQDSGVSKQAIQKSFYRIIQRILEEMEKRGMIEHSSKKPSTPLKFKRRYKP